MKLKLRFTKPIYLDDKIYETILLYALKHT